METYKVTVDEYGTICWYQNDKRHRLDGPAIEYADGHKTWYQNDKRHRLDGPAVESSDGSNFWHKNGRLHRLDGPAVECASGDKSWYIEGVKYTEEEFNAKINSTCEAKP